MIFIIGLENTNNKNGVQSFESVTANCPEFYISVLLEVIFNLCNPTLG